MDAESKFAIHALDHTFKVMGCGGGLRGDGTWAWTNPRAGKPGHVSIFSFAPDADRKSIRQDHVVTGALRLGLDPAEVVRRLKDSGGEILDP